MTMHRAMPEPTSADKEAMFRLVWMGFEEARRGRPLRKAHDLDTASQRLYGRGRAAWKAHEREGN